jgi:cytochrome c oxidase cbb3-type subunit 4
MEISMQAFTAYLSAISSTFGLFVFLGIIWWAWSKQRKAANEESANLPFALPDEFQKDQS